MVFTHAKPTHIALFDPPGFISCAVKPPMKFRFTGGEICKYRFYVSGQGREDKNAYHMRWLMGNPIALAAREYAYSEDERQHEWKRS